ncbi:hypothetical protein SAMN05443247_04888 [Bradyrhizobium erythrophlei]|jgi:hypothetical protein|nr:hypothetical protein SAMN05443247_04888 [Bradyrhizobium erythrophlei]
MVDMLGKLDPDKLDQGPERRAAIDELPAGTLASTWTDILTQQSPMRTGQPSITVAVCRIGAIEVWIGTLEALLMAG